MPSEARELETMNDQESQFTFDGVSSNPSFSELERKVQSFWDENGIEERALQQRADAPRYVFFEGPPTANGMPHPGHCLTRAMKDLFPRYQTMRGKLCERKGGWDTHGLPVETEVCKDLGIHSKAQIEEYGIEPFVRLCQQSVFRYIDEWKTMTRRIGYWLDLDKSYATFHQYYVESVWWALKRLFEEGHLYQGEKIVWWWAQGGTGLSAGEVGEGYREVDDPSVYVRIPRLDSSGNPDGSSFVAWTTTPWTLLSNQFLAVHPDLDYATVEKSDDGTRLILAEALVETLAQKLKCELEVVERCKGSDLVGQRYQPPYDCYWGEMGEQVSALIEGDEDSISWRVVAADFVTVDSGTGVVHQAPAFGEVDHEVLMKERNRFQNPDGIPLLCAVNPDGTFSQEAGESYRGRWVKDCDKEICRELRDRGVLLLKETYRHDYPFCPRAQDDPLIQYPRNSWFIRTTRFVDDMLANNREITWLPQHIQEGRFGKYLESNVDWTLSRERFWGTPLPIWVCERSGKMEAIESYDELLAKPGVEGTEVWLEALKESPDLDENLKVHRPYIDEVTYDSPEVPGARMRRVPDVIDCWFDAGCMPFAQWGFPHQNVDRFSEQFPADFISEAIDQTRGWFYALLSISSLLFGPSGAARGDSRVPEKAFLDWPHPYRNCIVLGLLLSEDGMKMSKSKKNYRTPDYIFDNEGADAMRWLFFSGQAPWTSIRFQESAITEGQREFLLRWWNTYSFFLIYACIDGWQPSGDLLGTPSEDAELTELDRWILGELNSTVETVTEKLDQLDNYAAARALNDFIDGLSNWYVRRGRDRYWRSGMDADKDAAYSTLYHCLTTMSLLAAPFVPFFSESLYQNLVCSRNRAGEEHPVSVHLCNYPEAQLERIDRVLSSRMAMVRQIASLGRACRSKEKLRVRLPLPAVRIILADSGLAKTLSGDVGLIAEELNVKLVEFVEDASEYVSYEVKPNFRTIGPRFGKDAHRVSSALAEHADPASLVAAANADEAICLLLGDGSEITLEPEDLDIRVHQKEGWSASQGHGVVVVLSTDVTPDLKREGMAREVVHHVQALRKELDLSYDQRLDLAVETDGDVALAVREHQGTICSETLAESLTESVAEGAVVREVEIEGIAARISVRAL